MKRNRRRTIGFRRIWNPIFEIYTALTESPNLKWSNMGQWQSQFKKLGSHMSFLTSQQPGRIFNQGQIG